jgi:hypothetical protein
LYRTFNFTFYFNKIVTVNVFSKNIAESIASNGKSENGEKSREQNAVVVSKFRETDQLQRKLVPQDGL